MASSEFTSGTTLSGFLTRYRAGDDDLTNALLSWVAQEDRERQENYIKYREYYGGDHDAMLTDRQKAYLELKPHDDFSVNYTKLPVRQVSRRMRVVGFSAPEPLGGLDGILWDWWRRGRMDSKSKYLHTAAIRDGDTYLIVEWDNEKMRPVYHHNLAYDGNEGVKPHYNEETGKIEFASKRWRVYNVDGGFHRRMNLYFPDRIERYTTSEKYYEGGWAPFTGDGQPAVIPWVDERKQPLGVPIFHCKYNSDGERWGNSALKDIIGPQNALNKSVIDLIAAADTTGFRVHFATGSSGLEDDDGNAVRVQPGSWLYFSRPETQVGFIPGEDLRPLIEVVNEFKIEIAQITETPLHLFQVSGQNASEGAQKQQEVGIISNTEDTSVHFGDFWEDVMAYSVLLHNTFMRDVLPTDVIIDTLWGGFEVRDKIAHKAAQTAIVKELVDAGAGIESAAKFAGISKEEAEELARFVMPEGVFGAPEE